ncbi:hypothetical protein Tco_0588750 [Tanacetum coccineum]
MKKELGNIAINLSYLDKTPVLKNSFPVAWRILFTFVIQVLGGNYSSTEQVNFIHQLLAYSLITRTKVDIGEIIYSDLVTKLLNKSWLKYISYPRFISCALQVLLGSDYTQDKKFGFLPPILSNSNFTKDPSKVIDIELTAHMIAVNNQRDSVPPPPSAPKPKKGKSQTVTPTLPKGNKQPLDKDITSTTPDKGTAKTTPYPEGSLRDKDSGGNIPPTDMKPIHNPVADPSGTGAKYQPDTKPLQLQTYADIQTFLLSDDELDKESDKEEVLAAGDDMDEDPQDDAEVRTLSPDPTQPEPSHEQHEEAAISYADLKASIDQYYDENIAHRDQTDKLVEASMSTLDRSSTTISDLYKGLDVITRLLKDINNVVKDDPPTNQKLNEATETFARISSNITEVLSLVKGFDFSALLSTVKDLQAHALKQEEASASWTKSSTNMSWNLGSIMTAVEISQSALKCEVFSLRQDTLKIKSMMVEIYQAFKGQPSSTPSGSVTPTLALTHIPANIKEDNATNTATEEPPSHTKGETGDTTMAIPISSIHPTEVQPTHDQPITSVISHPKGSHATPRIDKGKRIATESDEDPSKRLVLASTIISPDPDEPEKMKKAAEEAKLLAMSRLEVIKVVRKEAKKLGIDPKEAISTKTDETFKKAQDTEHEVLKREHSKKVKRLTELNRKRVEEYMNNDKRNFDVHKPFKFSDFGITELDKLGRKRKHMELEPKVKVPGLECNRSLPKGIPFVNHMVIEEPEYGIFFIDVFGDQAFQRWDDIYKVGVDSLVSYLVMASMVKTEEKLKSKKVKLEALGYHIE